MYLGILLAINLIKNLKKKKSKALDPILQLVAIVHFDGTELNLLDHLKDPLHLHLQVLNIQDIQATI